MSRVPLPTDAELPADSRSQLARMTPTNLKRTLAWSPTALEAFARLAGLRAEAAGYLGDRRTALLAHAVSSATECLVCGTFFRKALLDLGADPDAAPEGPFDADLVAFGRALAGGGHGVPDDLFARLAGRLPPAGLVAVTAFAGLLLATNVFNNAMRTDLDDHLGPYRKG